MLKRTLLKSTALATSMFCGGALASTSVFINEIHYDNEGSDTGEFVEIAGPTGTDLSGWQLVFYNGSATQLKPYATANLNGVLSDDTGSGYGFVVITQSGIQNGSPDGLALVDDLGQVVQFLSYEGVFTAAEGVAAGLTSEDIGVSEPYTTPIGQSLQLQGSGALASDFSWSAGVSETPDALNVGQSLNGSDTGGEPDPVDPGVTLIPIYEIQGAGHTSPYVGQTVTTSGIITATDSNGIYVQDPVGDGDDTTSDAIFVYTGTGHGLMQGDEVTITGSISEFFPGGASTGNLSLTEFYRPEITVDGSNSLLPPPVIIGSSGRVPPSEIIDDDTLSTFDPKNDGIDFYESLEGMLVTLEDAVAVAPTNRYGEIFALAHQGDDATGRNIRGGITITPDDFNPERVQIDFDSGILDFWADVDTGDLLGDVTGVVGYSYGNFEIYPTEEFYPESAGLDPETSILESNGKREVSIATYNVLNLDPNDSDGDTDVADGRFERIAEQIVNSLNSPAIIALQEVQDNSGSTDDGEVSAGVTLEMLTAAIAAAGGPNYDYIDNPPVNNQDGGQPGGNIRVAFLYDSERAEPEEITRLEDTDLTDGDAFAGARKPLYASFEAGDEILHIINNHFSSKGGSTPLFGQIQPPVNGSEDERIAQAKVVNSFVHNLIDSEENEANIVVLGDLNEFDFMQPLKELEGLTQPVLANLTHTLPTSERYSYIYQGNSQALDHILVSHNLAQHASYDIVHINSEFSDYASDHDPAVLLLNLQESAKTRRFSTFNISFNRYNAGDLISDLSTPDNAQAQAVAEIIQRARPDVLLLNEFDFDNNGEAVKLFKRNYLKKSQNGAKPIRYRYVYLAPSNTGIDSGFDLDNDGNLGGPGDAQGFGYFPGQYGMVVLSRYPIAKRKVRTFQNFLWKDMPDSMLPIDWYDTDEQAVLRLSSKSHWDIPIKVNGKTIHVLASHPTPPVFDGPEDRNGRRNHDEIRFWMDYISGENYMYDDKGRYGGLKSNAHFVIMGDLNADPHDGDSTGNPTAQLLAHPDINASLTPVSAGGAEASARQGGSNASHLGGAAFDTADFADGSPGNLRVDYVLPSQNLDIVGAGVFWPTITDPLFDLVGDYPFPSSDHRLVWIDLKKNKRRKR